MILVYKHCFSLIAIQQYFNNKYLNNINSFTVYQQNYLINNLFLNKSKTIPIKLLNNVQITNNNILFKVAIDLHKVTFSKITNFDQYLYQLLIHTIKSNLRPFFNFNVKELYIIKNKLELRQDILNFRILSNVKRISEQAPKKLNKGFHELNKHLDERMGQLFNNQLQQEYIVFSKLAIQNNTVNSILLAKKLFEYQLFNVGQRTLKLSTEVPQQKII